MKFERNILLYALLSGLTGTIVSLIFVWTCDLSNNSQISLILLLVLTWLGFAFGTRSKVIFPLRTLTNLLEALREKDFSMRVRGASHEDALGELIFEVNALAQALQNQRFNAMETTALLRKILAEIDIAMFGFDGQDRLILVNDSGCQLLGGPEQQVLGCHVHELELQDCLVLDTPRIVDLTFPGGGRRWELRRTTYRERGQSNHLIFLSDMTRTLHEEERQAWKRLIQILRHEINNSLTPIQSVAQSLQVCLKQTEREPGWEDDLNEGLSIIAERSEVLGRFIASYSQLTRLPDPTREAMQVTPWIHHVAALETRVTVDVTPGHDIFIYADRGQLDQLLINLVSNAAEAGLATEVSPKVTVRWDTSDSHLQVFVDDNGPGLNITQDPFLPFVTSKPDGQGIGLALSRQIAEAHGGDLTLVNHQDSHGCQALLRLPLGVEKIRG
ncbi:PAS domain-containing sensor histidine kinase [Planctomycetota bacterium]